MAASFSSRESEIRTLGRNLEAEVAKGDELPKDAFENLLRLPRSDVHMLKDTILSLCDARLGGRDAERISRLQDCGATTIRYFGLAFDDATINGEFVPRLLSMAESTSRASPRHVSVRISRYERLAAIAQLAPRIREESLDDVLQGALEMAAYKGKFEPDLLLPLGNFERAYRTYCGVDSHNAATRCQNLCLDSIRAILETTVQALAEVNDGTLHDAVSILPLVHTAGVSLLTILPSVTQTDDPDCISKMVAILDHCEWLLSRGEGFPGNYVNRSEIESFDRVRSVLSLSVAMLSMNCPEYYEIVQEMRIAEREGEHRLGTAALEFARAGHGKEGVTLIRNLVLHELEADAAPGVVPLNRESMLEVSALAWHLDVKDSPFVRKAINRVRDPRGQFYLAKALEGAPWG